jgi:flagellar biosynthesis anti-sigma factor FlgM
MKIEENNYATNVEAYHNRVQERGKKNIIFISSPENRVGADRVELSARAKEIKAAGSLLDRVPDIRAEKVADVKRAVDSGTYEIKGKKIALNMIKESLFNEVM